MSLIGSLVRNYSIKVSFGFNWCRIADVFLTAETSEIDIYKLNVIIERFDLKGSLLS